MRLGIVAKSANRAKRISNYHVEDLFYNSSHEEMNPPLFRRVWVGLAICCVVGCRICVLGTAD